MRSRKKNVIIFGLPEAEDCTDREYVDKIIGLLPDSDNELNSLNVAYSRVGR